MTDESSRPTAPNTKAPNTKEREPYRVRLPGFVNDKDIGLGDAVTRVTSLFGIKPCGGCERRAATLNRWMAFSGRHSR